MTYAEKKALGLCVRCSGKREPGVATCATCREIVNTRRGPVIHRPSTSGPFNVCCQASGFHRDGCREAPKP